MAEPHAERLSLPDTNPYALAAAIHRCMSALQ